MSTLRARGGRWIVAAFCASIWSSAAFALTPDVYLRDGRRLDVLSPLAAAPHDEISATLAPSEAALLATFTTLAPFPMRVDAAQAALWLAAGATGWAACAEVTIELLRVREEEVVVVATGVSVTSIERRRRADQPVIVDVPVAVELTEPERLGVAISVRNLCAAPRTVTLLYDALGAASRVGFTDTPIDGTTTTTTTTLSTATSTTLPSPPSCLARPEGGFPALICQLDVLDVVLRSELLPTQGRSFRARALRLSRRAQVLVAAAQEADRGAPRRLRRTVGVLTRLAARVQRGGEQGRLHAVAARDLLALVALAAGDARRLEILVR